MAAKGSNYQQSIYSVGYFKLGQVIGKGVFGEVRIGEHMKIKKKVAVKILPIFEKNPSATRRIKREIACLNSCKHFHIIKLYQNIQTRSNILLIMEYVSGGDLYDYINTNNKLKEDTARRFFQQIISGVDHCHRNMIVHRDLKPANLLLDKNLNVKIADFGFSNIMKDGKFLHTRCGSPGYAAPEIMMRKYTGTLSDIWSCGVILYTLLCGKMPFDHEETAAIYALAKSGMFCLRHLNKSVMSLICHMLQVDPMKRATMEDVKNHEWFKKDLPPNLFVTPAKQDSSVIDMDAVNEVCKVFDVKKEEVKSAILNKDSKEHPKKEDLAVAYHLIVDDKRIADESAKPNFKVVASGSLPTDVSLEKPINPSELHPKAVRVISKKWCMGKISQFEPDNIMAVLCKIMSSLKYQWQITDGYKVIMRRKDNSNIYSIAKWELYQIDDKNYAVNFIHLPDSENKTETGASGEVLKYTREGFTEMYSAMITHISKTAFE